MIKGLLTLGFMTLAVVTTLTMSVSASADWPHDGPIDIQDMRSNLQKYVKNSETECGNIDTAATTLIQDLTQYQTFLVAGKNKDAQKKLSQVKAEVAAPRPCQDYFYKIYLAKSLEILLDDDLIEFRNNYGPRLKDFQHQELRKTYRLQPGQVEMATSNDTLYFLSLLLINRIPVDFLSDQKRIRLTQSAENSLWLQQSTKTIGRYEILGAFKCNDHRIFLDPSLPPYDLAATWMHETDHLFRDLFGPEDAWKEHPLEAIRTDELLASAMTTFSQWNVRRAVMPRWAPFSQRLANLFLQKYGGNLVLDQFFFNGDLSFINRQGPLSILYSPNGAMKSVPVRYNIFHLFWAYFNKAQWFVQNDDFEDVHIDWNYRFCPSCQDPKVYKASELVASADQKVIEAYFGDAELEKYNPKVHPLEELPLSQFAHEVTFRRYMDSIKDEPGLGWGMDTFEINFYIQYFSDSRNSYGQLVYPEHLTLDKVVNELERRLSSTSPSCKAFEAAEQEGKLGAYLSDDRPGKDGSRPGKDGSRPGKDGSRPAQDIRPCLDLHDQL